MSVCALLTLRLVVPLLLVAVGTCQAAAVSSEHVEAELVAERLNGAPGSELWLGLRLKHAPHWHTYWVNPGDSGLQTKLFWTLPDHSNAGDIAWPAPKRLGVGELYNFGYDGEVMLPVQVNVPDALGVGATMHVGVRAQWLECEELCIPAKVNLSLDIPIGRKEGALDPRWKSLFEMARQTHPLETDWYGTAILRGDQVTATVVGKGLPTQSDLEVFPLEPGIVSNGTPTISRGADTLVVKMGKNEYFANNPNTLTLVMISRSARPMHAWRITVPLRESNTDAVGASADSGVTGRSD
ncbi:MAG: protein-disulfide reductase DsbD domain-containing protein [Tahibacter sp.]